MKYVSYQSLISTHYTHCLLLLLLLLLPLLLLLLRRSMQTCYICSPVRRRSVAVPLSLFRRELSVGQVLSLSLLCRGHDCRPDFSIPIFFVWLRSLQWPVLSRNIMVCSWRDIKRRVSCWGLQPPFLCLKSDSLLFLMSVFVSW